MTDDATRYPLSWPAGWKRTPSQHRKHAKFRRTENVTYPSGGGYQARLEMTVAVALDRLEAELRRLGALQVVVSTNIRTRNDGRPYSNSSERPADPGAAVYFEVAGKPRALACDRWNTVADNLAAIGAHVEAIRAVDRYGVGTIEQAFAGYAALPPDPSRDWRVVLELSAATHVDADLINDRYRELAKKAHPDAGGSHDAMARLNAARDAALAELG